MIEIEVYKYLSQYAGLTALVGDRIYPMILPQDAVLPAVTCEKISGQRINTKFGPAGLVRARIQVSCWAKGYLVAKQVAEQVRLALAGFPGGTVYLENEVDLYEEGTGIYHVPVDFTIWYEE